jgi:hypothetical protein
MKLQKLSIYHFKYRERTTEELENLQNNEFERDENFNKNNEEGKGNEMTASN